MAAMITRRDFSRLFIAGIAGSVMGPLGIPKKAYSSTRSVVVIGGGFGGAAAARHIKEIDPSVAVTLVEPKVVYYTCPLSNWVFCGLQNIQELAQTYRLLTERYGVDVIADRAFAIDPITYKVRLEKGKVLEYDRLVVSPGVSFDWNAIDGYSEEVATGVMPHAYEAGPQTLLLQKQLTSMKDGGTVIICPPGGEYRCPVAPYERASLIAHYLKKYKSKSRVLVLDGKDGFSDQDQFMKGWERFYPGMIEWRGAFAGGKVESVNSEQMSVATEFGDEFADVINVIPPQKAGKIALDTGLADASGWCPVNPLTLESTIHPGIHVIGDACKAAPMPKSGFAAGSQGKVAASAVLRLFNGELPRSPSFGSICYSLVTQGYGFSAKGSFSVDSGRITVVKGEGGMTPIDASDARYREEADQAVTWYRDITTNTWG
ncbi:NAD(P)/FAD-dependent oxidoreductase [Prosthecochloris sp.]|uniref:NAD(P)/FAD-dependent oxidoreductase n=1 Tax=Prosthecochloris sp. TaxID=290513 RepID=UPI0025D544E3|nr:NAD(P)/FAD-dependent oxidoreductase [Prosthecochloris sp.]